MVIADTGSRVQLPERRSGEHTGCFDFILPLSAAGRGVAQMRDAVEFA